MSKFITWKKINNYDYFALGLQPYFKKSHKPIPCPEYCHEYYILFNTPRYTPRESTREKLKKWKNEIKRNKTISICFTNCPEPLLYLIKTCGNSLSHSNMMNTIELTVKDVQKLEAVLDQEFDKYNKRLKKLEETIDNDPDLNSWKSFQMPDSEEDVDELCRLLEEAIFDDKEVDKINESLGITNKKEPIYPQLEGVDPADSCNIEDIDYSGKSKSEQATLAAGWKKEGKTRREIAKRLYKKEVENGFIKIESLMRKIGRLLE